MRIENEQLQIIKGEHQSIKLETAVLKERDISLRTENDRLKNELATLEQRYQQRREEDLQMWERMMATFMKNSTEDRKRKRVDGDDSSN